MGRNWETKGSRSETIHCLPLHLLSLLLLDTAAAHSYTSHTSLQTYTVRAEHGKMLCALGYSAQSERHIRWQRWGKQGGPGNCTDLARRVFCALYLLS